MEETIATTTTTTITTTTTNNPTIKDAFDTSEDRRVVQSWDELDLHVNLLRGVFAYGYEKPSPIQQRAILPIIEGRDVVGQAQSGTGKTATFSIGALQRVDVNNDSTQVLILSPTRELASQTSGVVEALGIFMSGLRVQTLVGGYGASEGGNSNNNGNSNNTNNSNSNSSSSFLARSNPHIVCGCPGRVYDSMRRGKLDGSSLKLVILDEADEMLSVGFKEQVWNIFQQLNSETQVCLFSATLPDSLNTLLDRIMRNPVRISVKREQLTLEGIQQYFIGVDNDRQKYATLKDLFSHVSLSQTIIYCNSVKRVQDLYEAMCEDGFPVSRIHSSMDKVERDRSFRDFRNGVSRVLISSNVTARGIDVQQVSVVINFDLPRCVHTYLHRIGRSGRWGRKGVGINLITSRDVTNMQNIKEHYETQIVEMPGDLTFLASFT